MDDLSALLEISSRDHNHLCPRQILGVRLALRGIRALRLQANQGGDKRLLVITESDGCFADGLSAATNCTVGHRTLRVEDYGKTAAVFIDTDTNQCIRVAPALDIRQRAYDYACGESRHYFAQMQAYKIIPDREMFTVTEVQLVTSIESIISRPGMRVDCGVCGEEIMNEREVRQNSLVLCRTCAGTFYYQMPVSIPLFEKTIV